MCLSKTSRNRRHGVATVEMALLLPLLLMILVGIWVVGRMVYVSQIMNNAAREGGRVAAQGQIVNLLGSYTEIQVTGSNPSIHDTVDRYLQQAKIDTTGLQVTVELVGRDSDDDGIADPVSPSPIEPFEAIKGDQLRITVQIPIDNIRWSTFVGFEGLFAWALPDPDFMIGSVEFYSVKDEPFTVLETFNPWDGYE